MALFASINSSEPHHHHYNDPCELYHSPSPPEILRGQHFGNGLHLEELFPEVKCDKDKYQVHIDVSHFKPNEINVKTIQNVITIEGNHEEKPDGHGYVVRSFKRRYSIPDDVDPSHIHCNLSSNGILTLEAPRAAALEDKSKERSIPIHTSPGLAHAQALAWATQEEIARAKALLMERKQHLKELDAKTEKLESDASNFSSTAHDLMLKEQNKKWYQF